MRSVAPAVLAAVLLLHGPVGGAHPVHAQDWDEEEYGGDEASAEQGIPPGAGVDDTLSPYGSWIDDDRYGRMWEPAVSIGWAPYVDGSWAWTPDGWTWVSDEPWAWTFHYGRWILLPTGWAWVPGSVWGPAWVDWFWGDGFVGWAPLSPFGVTVINEFVFVHAADFCSHDLARRIVNHHLVPDRVVHHWQQRGPGHGRPPSIHRIERVSQHHVTRLDHRPPRTIAPRAPQLVRPVQRGQTRLGRAWWRDAPETRGVARLGHPWEPRHVPQRAPAFASRSPAAGAPPPAWRLGAAQGPGVVRPVAPRMGVVRPASPGVAGRGVGRPAPGLRPIEPGHASGPGAPGGHRVQRGGSTTLGRPGSAGLQ